MPSIYTYGGKPILYGDKLGISESCCCGANPCCDPINPCDTLDVTLTDASNCPCADTVTFQMVWNAVDNVWEGIPDISAECSLVDGATTFRIGCGDNPAATKPCMNYFLQISGGSCIADPVFASSDCSCDPFTLDFDLELTGLGCCDGADPFSPSTVHVHVECTPP